MQRASIRVQSQVGIDRPQVAYRNQADHDADASDQQEWRVPAPPTGQVQSQWNSYHAAGAKSGLENAHDAAAQLVGEQISGDGKYDRANHAGENPGDLAGKKREVETAGEPA